MLPSTATQPGYWEGICFPLWLNESAVNLHLTPGSVVALRLFTPSSEKVRTQQYMMTAGTQETREPE